MTLSIRTLSITTISITTISIMRLFATLSITFLSAIMLSVTVFIAVLSVVMLNGVRLSVWEPQKMNQRKWHWIMKFWSSIKWFSYLQPRNTDWRGRLSTVDLLVLTSLDKLLLKLKTLFTSYKMSWINEEVNCTEPSPSVCIPCCNWNNLIFSLQGPSTLFNFIS